MATAVIVACAHCGSRELRMAGLREGRLPGVTGGFDESVCRDCGRRGVPLQFEKEEDWRAFREEPRSL